MLFDEWDNSGGGGGGSLHGSSVGRGGGGGGGGRLASLNDSYDSDVDEERVPDARAAMPAAMPVGGRAHTASSHSALGGGGGHGGASHGSLLHPSSVIVNPSDASLAPTDQVGGLSVVGEGDGPMFQLERLDWRPSKEQGALVGLAVGCGVLMIATQNCNIIRWNVDTDEFEEIVISKRADDRIHKVFLDPTGTHGVIAMENGQVYYMHNRWNKAHLLSKVKGVIIESIAWNPLGTDASTKKILIGTNRGLIYETHIEDKDKYFKKVHDLCTDDVGANSGQAALGSGADLLQPTTPVSGLYMELFPSSTPAAASSKGGDKDDPELLHKWFVMAATPNRQFQFIGGPSFESLFAKYTGNIPNAFKDFPGGLNYSELRFFSKYQGRTKGAAVSTADTCAWLNGVGIFYGNLVFGSQDKGQDVLQNGKLLPYPAIPDPSGGGLSRPQAPLSLTMTEFHFLLVFRNRLLAVNQLSEEIVYEEVFNTQTFGEMQGLATDARKDTVWLYSDKFVFAVDVLKEDRDAWKLYLADGKFELALSYCDTDQQTERVNNAKADYLFEQGSFEQAAAIYASTSRSFEEVALKFVNIASGLPVPNATTVACAPGATTPGVSPISTDRISSSLQADARAALKAYLLAKLEKLQPSELTQQVMICTWLTEIFLDNINRLQGGAVESAGAALRKRNQDGGVTPGLVSTTSPFPDVSSSLGHGDDGDLDDDGPAADSDEAAVLANDRAQQQEDEVKEFREFLLEYFDCLNRETTFELIASHGRVSELLYYALIIHDLDWILNYHIQQKNFFATLDILDNHVENPAKNAELYYKFAPTLMAYLPRQTVDMLIDLGKQLDPAKLIPALMRYNEVVDATAGSPGGSGGGSSGAGAGGSRHAESKDEDRSDYDDTDDDEGGRSDRKTPTSSSSSGGASSVNHAIRYLEYMVLMQKSRDPVLHNYLISLYAKQKDERPLLAFIQTAHKRLTTTAAATTPLGSLPQTALTFDYKYALRVCHESNKLRSCVAIYQGMRLYEEAVRMALEIDLELAKSVVADAMAVSALDDTQLKRLWILIARYVIQHEPDIGRAMKILKECDVQLEQILPFFPDFVKIGDFKEEINKSLNQYNGRIERLKGEMEEFTHSANLIRQDIHALRSRYGVVSSHQKCDLCSQPVLNKHFLLFPCTHAFHTACAVGECTKYLSAHPALKAKVLADDEAREAAAAAQAIAQGTSSLSGPAAAAAAKSAAAAAPEPTLSREAREARCMEHYAASECCLCGEIMIDSVAMPFINLPEEDAEVKAWEV